MTWLFLPQSGEGIPTLAMIMLIVWLTSLTLCIGIDLYKANPIWASGNVIAVLARARIKAPRGKADLMVFGFGKGKTGPQHREISAPDLHVMVGAGEALIVDVREADEFAAGHIPGAVNMPLSTFQPSRLPDSQGKTLVLNCLGGKRSAMALDKCGLAQAAVDTHLAGGFGAWQAAGFPVEQ